MIMVKKIFSIVFIFLMLLPTLWKTAIMIDFKLNQDFIIEMFCINNESPIVMCSGACYLSDQLNKVDENQQKGITIKVELKNELIYPKPMEEELCWLETDLYIQRIIPNIPTIKSSSHLDRIFRPPKA